MDIQLLASELCNIESYSDPVKKLYDENISIPAVVSSADIYLLNDIIRRCTLVTNSFQVSSVNIKVMKTHARVVKPYISISDIEDDFI